MVTGTGVSMKGGPISYLDAASKNVALNESADEVRFVQSDIDNHESVPRASVLQDIDPDEESTLKNTLLSNVQ